MILIWLNIDIKYTRQMKVDHFFACVIILHIMSFLFNHFKAMSLTLTMLKEDKIIKGGRSGFAKRGMLATYRDSYLVIVRGLPVG
jgi:hypothetical protein